MKTMLRIAPERPLTRRVFRHPCDSFPRAVALAMSQPDEVDINEIRYRPTRQEL